MAQSAFDHWLNMHADTAHADRRLQKKKLRERNSSGRNYQVGEDVWARYPGYNIMYVASVMAVNNYKRTCTVIFNNGLTADLSISHLRHVTLKDIQCDRYVDYGEGWSERTDTGAIDIYDRYGELQETHFTGTSKHINNDFFTDEENNCVNDHTVDDVPSSNDINEDKVYIYGSSNSLTTEIFMVPIPDPEEPTATYCRCPVWNVSSYAEAEAKAMELINQDFDYLKAIERAKHRQQTFQQPGSLHSKEVNMPQSYEILAQTEFRLTECGSQSLFTEPSTLMCRSSTGLADQQPPSGNMNEIGDRTNVQDFPKVEEIGMQTEAFIHRSTATINPQHESIVAAYSNQPAQDVSSLPMSNKRSNTCSSQYHEQMRKAMTSTSTYTGEQQKFSSKPYFNKSFTYASTKFLLSILLITMIIGPLSTGSMIYEKDMNAVPLITRHMVLSAIPILIATIMPFSFSVKGPSRFMLELWLYLFGVP